MSIEVFLSTLSLRRATFGQQKQDGIFGISIHALLAESDRLSDAQLARLYKFLSTLSLRRATISCAWSASKLGDFYPRSPCGERPEPVKVSKHFMDNFYPRSPCGERRTTTTTICIASKFLSTLSLRRATYRQGGKLTNQSISIHALLAESDRRGAWPAR